MAHQKMIEKYGKDKAYTGGYKVFTTVSSQLQNAAHLAVTNNLLRYDQRHGYRGAELNLRPEQKELENKPFNDSNNDSNDSPSDATPLTEAEIAHALASVHYYQMLEPAVVTQVDERSVNIMLRGSKQAIINWSGLAWARAYINDRKQGPAPKLANEILKIGDVILVSQEENNDYRLSQLPLASAALVSVSPDNGAIKAAVGGFSFKQSQFNRVTQAKRQVGSNIKPFIYSAALDNGFTLASLVNDAPINQWDKSSGQVWRPKNSPPTYVGPIRVRLALAQSKNVIAVRLLKSIGLDKAINYLSNFGFAPDELPHNESLALGSASLTPLEVVTGFATFANGGFLVDPYLIERIEDAEGEVIYQANPSLACDPCELADNAIQNVKNITNTQPSNHSDDLTSFPQIISAPRVISEQNAFLITQALNSAIWGADWSTENGWQGTGWRARALKRRDIVGKTGTTNEAKDAWFSGFSRRLVTTSWIGFDDPSRNLGQSVYNNNLGKNQITGKEFGAKSAQPAWIDFMKVALTNLPVEPFEPPTDILSVRIDKTTGKLSTNTNKSSLFEYFQIGTAPSEYVSQDNSIDIFQSDDEAKNEEEELF